MTSIFDTGGPQFGLDDVKIATLNADDTYGAAVDVPSVQMYETGMRTVNAELEGDDKITDTHARGTKAEVRLRFGSISFAALSVLTGKTKASSIDLPDSTDVFTLSFDNIKFPYFGICGRALSTQDDGDTHVFVPKCKIMEGFNVGLQYGQYTIPELTCSAVADVNGNIVQIVEHEVALAVTIPPNFGEA